MGKRLTNSPGKASPNTGLAAELRWLGGVLGEARDAEVLAAQLRGSLRDIPAELILGPIEARIQGHFASLQATARKDVLAGLDSPPYFALLAVLDQLLNDPPLTPEAARPAGDVLPGGCAGPGTRRPVRAGRSPTTTPASQPSGLGMPGRRPPRPSAGKRAGSASR